MIVSGCGWRFAIRGLATSPLGHSRRLRVLKSKSALFPVTEVPSHRNEVPLRAKGFMHRSRYRSSLCQDQFLTGTSWLERVRGFWNLPRSMRRTHKEESAPTISFVVIIALAYSGC